MMTLPDDDKTYGEKRTQTKMQMIENIIMIQANFNEAVIAFMNTKSKSPRPSRLRRQEKRRQKAETQNWIEKLSEPQPPPPSTRASTYSFHAKYFFILRKFDS